MKISNGIMNELLIFEQAVGTIYEYRLQDMWLDGEWKISILRRPKDRSDDWQIAGYL